jgi:hypothetical protein
VTNGLALVSKSTACNTTPDNGAVHCSAPDHELRTGPGSQAAPRCDYREDFDEINDETG